MRMQSFHLSTQGASHIKKNKECQDASESYYDENCAIAIVCDGHGGDDYVRSAVGSAFAASIAKDNILNFISNVNKDELKRHHPQLINTLQASIISAWSCAIHDHYEENPFTAAEIAVLSERAKRKYLQEQRVESAYGTTLIAVASTKDYWFGIHIGDGKCVAVNPEGKFVQPIPWDEKCFLNATTSICDSDALNRFRYFYSEKLPAAVFVGSDGVDDCFSSEQQLNNLYKTVLYSFATSDFSEAVEDLGDYLPRLSAKGSGDDVSVAAILDLDMIGEISVVKEFDKEKEKARVEENARIAAHKAEEERKRVEAERAEQLRQQQAQKVPAIKRCGHCGAKLHPGMKFCSECGARIVPAASGTTVAPAQPDPNATPDELKIIKIVPFGSDSSVPATENANAAVITPATDSALAADSVPVDGVVVKEVETAEEPAVEVAAGSAEAIESSADETSEPTDITESTLPREPSVIDDTAEQIPGQTETVVVETADKTPDELKTSDGIKEVVDAGDAQLQTDI